MTTAHIPGYPRIGDRRELKTALEAFWRGELDEKALKRTGRELRAGRWQRQRTAGLDYVTVGDFAWYDQVLETIVHLGCVPRRFGFDPAALTLAQYFQLARGNEKQPPLEMTKWFDTNYHYLVPEWTADTRFDGGVDWLFDEIAEARELGHPVKVVLIGPLTLLHLGKIAAGTHWAFDHKLELLPWLLQAYERLLARIKAAGVDWVQMDEPVLALDLDETWQAGFRTAYTMLAPRSPKILLTTYFGSVAHHASLIRQLPVAGVHLDLVRGHGQLPAFLEDLPDGRVLSCGVVDGRNVWRSDLESALNILQPIHERLGDRLWVSSGCSLMHVPVDLGSEDGLEDPLRSWLAFAVQKLDEIATLKTGLEEGPDAVREALDACTRALDSRDASESTHVESVRRRLAAVDDAAARRASPFARRIQAQHKRLKLPLFPTTTIGSFPQTPEIRKARAARRQGRLDRQGYEEKMRSEIREAITRQEELGLDVLVHGEPERNDMVQYFAELLDGIAVTRNGWVQSYGSRCTKPPIIYGDVSRPAPMTVHWIRYAQSLTRRYVKGMLTGPVTILQWSFVRDDQPRELTANQIALALRDEVQDLERAGIHIIQVDEPALREGLPLRAGDHRHYLDWAVKAFRLSTSGVKDETQIHTHMCYSEFGEILPDIAALDADVITIESSRSGMELLDAFRDFQYPGEIGPGVYDIHSPRIPGAEEIVHLLERAREVIRPERLWVNPDCGLKTRAWPETAASLKAMVEAAGQLRRQALDAEPEARAASAGG